jgi:hypothetical protein
LNNQTFAEMAAPRGAAISVGLILRKSFRTTKMYSRINSYIIGDMLSLTNQALEKFDNQHDFERMCADIMNALGYKDVVLIAPKGGADGGRDITFTTSDGGKGLACVTLRGDSDKKFKEDFHQRTKGEYAEYLFFTNRSLTSPQKIAYEKYCVNTLEAGFLPQDIEALRSLLDSALTTIRKNYLHIDDDQTLKLKRQITKLFKYPKTLSPDNYKDRAGYAEWYLTDIVARELYYSICDIEDSDIVQTLDIGQMLLDYKEQYYAFCEQTQNLTQRCKDLISRQPLQGIQFQYGWLSIFFNYFLMRGFGWSQENAKREIVLNYGITDDVCENMFKILASDDEVTKIHQKIHQLVNDMAKTTEQLKKTLI